MVFFLIFLVEDLNNSNLSDIESYREDFENYIVRGKTLFYKDAVSAELYLNKALLLAERFENRRDIVRASIHLGEVLNFRSAVEAQRTLLEAEAQFEYLEDDSLYCVLIAQIGHFYLRWDDYAQSSYYYSKYLQFVEDNPELADPGTMAPVYVVEKQYEKALASFRLILEKQAKEEPHHIPATLSEMGNIHYQRKQYDSARIYYHRGMALARTHADDRSLGFLKDNVGLTFFKQGNYDSAIFWQRQSLRHREKVRSDLGITTILNNMSATFLALNSYDSALYYAKQNYPICRRFGRMRALEEVTETLTRVYGYLGMPDTSIYYLKRYTQYRDSIEQTHRNHTAVRMSLNFDINQQKLENKLLKVENKNFMFFMILLGFFMVVIVGFLFFLWRTNKTNKRLVVELKRANQTNKKLFSIISHDLRNPIGALKGVLDLHQTKKLSDEEFISLSPDLCIETNGAYLLLENLLYWAKTQIQQGKYLLEIKKCDLHKIAEEQISGLRILLRRGMLHCTNEIPKNTNLQSYPQEIGLVIRNLLANAIKYTPAEGKITLKILENTENTLKLAIQDTGTGMTEDEQKKMLDQQISFSKAGLRGEQGVGLGMKLVFETLNKLGGKLKLKSAKGKGTSIYITLPLSLS